MEKGVYTYEREHCKRAVFRHFMVFCCEHRVFLSTLILWRCSMMSIYRQEQTKCKMVAHRERLKNPRFTTSLALVLLFVTVNAMYSNLQLAQFT